MNLTVDVGLPPSESPGKVRTRGLPGLARNAITIYLAVGAVAVLAWQIASSLTIPLFLPAPARVAQAAVELFASGRLQEHVLVSYGRILTGWVIGCIVTIPLGLLAGRIRLVSVMLEPVINFFRFIPPIAFISLALIWFGIGETSKIALIVYTTAFIVFLNTAAGAQAVDIEKIRAGQSLGASRRQLLTTVVIPSTIPFVITGMRLAMGNSFMTVIAAELIAAEAGVGFLIMSARLFQRTDFIFVGIISLGLMGLCADLIFKSLTKRLAYRYGIKY